MKNCAWPERCARVAHRGKRWVWAKLPVAKAEWQAHTHTHAHVVSSPHLFVCTSVCGGCLISRKLKCYMHCHCPMAALRLWTGIVNSAAAAASIVPPRPQIVAHRPPPWSMHYFYVSVRIFGIIEAQTALWLPHCLFCGCGCWRSPNRHDIAYTPEPGKTVCEFWGRGAGLVASKIFAASSFGRQLRIKPKPFCQTVRQYQQ